MSTVSMVSGVKVIKKTKMAADVDRGIFLLFVVNLKEICTARF